MTERSYPLRNATSGKGTKRNNRTIEACTVTAKNNAAKRLHTHLMTDSLPPRNDAARSDFVECGGPPPPAHHRNEIKKAASAKAASGIGRIANNKGHTLSAITAKKRPETMARSEIGSFAQRLGATPVACSFCARANMACSHAERSARLSSKSHTHTGGLFR